MKISQMMTDIKKPATNQFIIRDNDKVIFQSYESKIAEYNWKEKTLKIYSNWDYSKTTLKYLKIFINNYTREFKYENKKNFLEEIRSNDKIKLVVNH